MIFRFAVRHLRWLGRVPLAPHLFDALLLAWTGLTRRETLRAIEQLELAALRLQGVKASRHKFGGIGFVHQGKEFAHLHGNGLLDIHLGRAGAEAAIASRHAIPHHVLGRSAWISFWLRSEADLEEAMKLLRSALS